MTRDSTTPCGAVFLRGPDGKPGLLVRVGALFGWAGGGDGRDRRGRRTAVDTRWASTLCGNQIQANGVRWIIERSEGNVNP